MSTKSTEKTVAPATEPEAPAPAETPQPVAPEKPKYPVLSIEQKLSVRDIERQIQRSQILRQQIVIQKKELDQKDANLAQTEAQLNHVFRATIEAAAVAQGFDLGTISFEIETLDFGPLTPEKPAPKA